MNFFTRLSNGWRIALDSFAVLKDNKQLIFFPVLSGISMLLVIGSFITAFFVGYGWDLTGIESESYFTPLNYLIVFLFYIVNYFIIVFFNTALVYCTHLYFYDEEVTIAKGLRFSLSRAGAILGWAVFAGTVGAILRILQENLGWIGRIITSLIGVVWSITTFFVVPVIAFENLGPIEAYNRSATLMREKWGESLGAGFSFGFIQIVGFLALGLLCLAIGAVVHPILGVILFILGVLTILTVMSAARMVFISAVYHNINGDPIKHFNQQIADNLFMEK